MEFLKNYFYFTKSERNGAMILIGLCILVLAIPEFIRKNNDKPSEDFEEARVLAKQIASISNITEEPDFERKAGKIFKFDPNTASFEMLQELGLSSRTAQSIVNYRKKGGHFKKAEDLKKIYTLREEDYKRLEEWIFIAGSKKVIREIKNQFSPMPFDPNTASIDTLLALGIKQKTAEAILRYRQKGGKFRKPEDLSKIYTLSEAEFKRLEHFIRISPSDTGQLNPRKFQKPEPLMVRVDINKADVETWQLLRGIGPGFAGKICRFREALGGFISIEQVGETKGLPDSTFRAILPFLETSPILRPISINSATVEELAAHPYIDYREASAIVAYRFQHGKFEKAKDLEKVLAIKSEKLEKLSPYLDFR